MYTFTQTCKDWLEANGIKHLLTEADEVTLSLPDDNILLQIKDGGKLLAWYNDPGQWAIINADSTFGDWIPLNKPEVAAPTPTDAPPPQQAKPAPKWHLPTLPFNLPKVTMPKVKLPHLKIKLTWKVGLLIAVVLIFLLSLIFGSIDGTASGLQSNLPVINTLAVTNTLAATMPTTDPLTTDGNAWCSQELGRPISGVKTIAITGNGSESDPYKLIGDLNGIFPNSEGETIFFVEENDLPDMTMSWLFSGWDKGVDQYAFAKAIDLDTAFTSDVCEGNGCSALWETSKAFGNMYRNQFCTSTNPGMCVDDLNTLNPLFWKNVPKYYHQTFLSWIESSSEKSKAGLPTPRCLVMPPVSGMTDVSQPEKDKALGKRAPVPQAPPSGAQRPPMVTSTPLIITATPTSLVAASVVDFVAPLMLPTATLPAWAPNGMTNPTPYSEVQSGAIVLSKLIENVKLLHGYAYVRPDSCSNGQPYDWSAVAFTISTRPDLYLYLDMTSLYPNYKGEGCASITLVDGWVDGYHPSFDQSVTLTGFSDSIVQSSSAPGAQGINPTPAPVQWKPVTLTGLVGEAWQNNLTITEDSCNIYSGKILVESQVYLTNGVESYSVDMSGYAPYLVVPYCTRIQISRYAPSTSETSWYMPVGNMYVWYFSTTPVVPTPTATPNLVWSWNDWMSHVNDPTFIGQGYTRYEQCSITGNEVSLAPEGKCSYMASRVDITNVLPQWDRAKPLKLIILGALKTLELGYPEVPGYSSWHYGPVK